MNLADLASTVAKYAPYLGMAIANPAIGAIGLIGEIAKKFGGSATDPLDLINRINLDPERQVKLAEIEKDKQIEIEKLALEQMKTANADLQDARASNLKNTKIVDEFVKVFLPISLVIVVFYCLHMLQTGEIKGVESNIICAVLGSAFTAILSMVYFHYGNSGANREIKWNR
jgi:hypothetical protein